MKNILCFALGWLAAFSFYYYRPFVLRSHTMTLLGRAHLGARVQFSDGGIARCFWEKKS